MKAPTKKPDVSQVLSKEELGSLKATYEQVVERMAPVHLKGKPALTHLFFFELLDRCKNKQYANLFSAVTDTEKLRASYESLKHYRDGK